MRILAVDLGSTYTKLTALESRNGSEGILATASAFTTIESDVMQGFEAALERLEAKLGPWTPERLLCCSSAGGGLSMVAVGLVPELTARAARLAAESAGAKVLKSFSFEMSDAELDEIYRLDPDIVLLAGGTDGGNKEVIVRNAGLLGGLKRGFSLIVAGNKSAAGAIEAALRPFGKGALITENVMPRFGTLNIEPARAAIRDIFIERIVEAKGLSGIRAMSALPIIPTPLAVLKACELLSLGTEKSPGIGEFMAVDLGGATTDVYSMAGGAPGRDKVLVKGLPEPFAKRSVEGDLGMRYSASFLLEAAGCDELALEAGVSPSEMAAWVARCQNTPQSLPRSWSQSVSQSGPDGAGDADAGNGPDYRNDPEDVGGPEDRAGPADACGVGGAAERRMEEAMARAAVARAVERHCGVMEKGYSPLGELYTLTGKDLSGLKKVIGIGGALINSARPEYILAGAKAGPQALAAGRMLPLAPRYYLDKSYIFSAMGLVSQLDPELALTIMKRELRELGSRARSFK